MASLRLKDILKGREDELGLKQLTGAPGLERLTDGIRVQRYDEAEGFRDGIIPGAILIITPACASELVTISPESRNNVFQAVISHRIPLMALSETDAAPGILISSSERYGIPLLASEYDEFLLESRISRLLREKIDNSICMHGTLVSVFGFGVIIVGDSGTGKTECSRKLVERGHRWIADDAVEIERRGNSLYGRGDEVTKSLVNIKDRGLVRAEELFGAQAIRHDSVIDLMVELKTIDYEEWPGDVYVAERLRDVMGVELPCVELPGFPETRRIYGYVEEGVKKLINEMERGCS